MNYSNLLMLVPSSQLTYLAYMAPVVHDHSKDYTSTMVCGYRLTTYQNCSHRYHFNGQRAFSFVLTMCEARYIVSGPYLYFMTQKLHSHCVA